MRAQVVSNPDQDKWGLILAGVWHPVACSGGSNDLANIVCFTSWQGSSASVGKIYMTINIVMPKSFVYSR